MYDCLHVKSNFQGSKNLSRGGGEQMWGHFGNERATQEANQTHILGWKYLLLLARVIKLLP